MRCTSVLAAAVVLGGPVTCTALYCTVLHCITALYGIVLHCTVLYCICCCRTCTVLYYCNVPAAAVVPGGPVLYCTALLHYITVLYLLLQLYLEDLEAKVMPVERSPPSLSSSLLSWAGTAVNLGPRLLRLNTRSYFR